ncbi:CU044_5270 family protein [Nonomuraea sp. NPDC050383]|uniref:CU044_5270 family protein n=1 Tax=Nonomuraea sp. NPDC050383 TaxID=3364362 RepID=UPI00378D92D7
MPDLNGHPFPGLPDDRDDLDAVRALLGTPEPSLDTVLEGRTRLLAALARDSGDADAGTDASAAGAQDRGPAEPRIVHGGLVPRAPGRTAGRRSRTGGRVGGRLAAAGAGLAVAATILVAATVAAPGGPVIGARPGTPPSAASTARGTPVASPAGTADAREVLLAAADAVAGAPAAGAYWRTTTVTRWQLSDKTRGYVFELGLEEDQWLARRPGDKSWKVRRYLGARPVTPADEAAWRAAGSPGSWRATTGEAVEAAPGQPHVSELRGKWKGSGGDLLKGLMTWEDLAAIPAGPAKLREYLEAGIRERTASPTESDDRLRDAVVRIVCARVATSPEVRASAYRLLASMPGLRAEGEVTDVLGRRGQAVVYRLGAGEERLVVDTRTGLPLGRDWTPDAPADGDPTVLRQRTAYRNLGWTGERPDLPAAKG